MAEEPREDHAGDAEPFVAPQFAYFEVGWRIRGSDGRIEEGRAAPALYPIWWFAELPDEPDRSR